MVSIPKEELLGSIPEENQPIKELILEQLHNPKDGKFSYNNSSDALGASDPFFTIEKPREGAYNLDNLYDWYLSKNPNFLPVNTEGLNIQVPEFAFLIAIMAKDLLILKKTRKYPQKHFKNTSPSNKYTTDYERTYFKCDIDSMVLSSNSKKELDDSKSDFVLNLINKFITTGYSYLAFLEILKHYLSIFNIGALYSPEITNSICKDIKIIDKLIKKPYIIFPTTVQLSYAKVIYTIQAPLINFRLSNNRKLIHDTFESPIIELSHDIDFHSRKTHMWEISAHNNNQPFNPKIEYPIINTIIQKLKPYISNTTGTQPDNYNNQLLTFIIFYIIHESGTVRDLFNLHSSIITLTKPNVINNNVFLEDEKLRNAVKYAYNQTPKQNRNDISKEVNVTIPLLKYILDNFGDLWKSLEKLLSGGAYIKTKHQSQRKHRTYYKSKTEKQMKARYKGKTQRRTTQRRTTQRRTAKRILKY